MKKEGTTTPKLSTAFLKWFCKPELFEEISGDIEEDFNNRSYSKGKRFAKLWHWLDVLSFLKPFAIRQIVLPGQKTHFIMFKDYFKTSIRNLIRHKAFTLINITGLSVGMSVCLLMIGALYEIHHYDSFHEDSHRIYRLNTAAKYQNKDFTLAATSPLAALEIQNRVSGIESATILKRGFKGTAFVNGESISLRGIYANEGFFEVFSFRLLKGNRLGALSQPNSIILTDNKAQALFGNDNPVGTSLKLGEKDYLITGVIENPPLNSHLKFESITSLGPVDNPSWENIWRHYSYFKINASANPYTIEDQLKELNSRENAKLTDNQYEVMMQPLREIIDGPKLGNDLGKSFNDNTLWILGILSVMVMLSAGFNYTNLSLARAFQRSKEVGIRRVIGARRSHLINQFVIEACTIAVLALILSVLFFFILKPLFLGLNDSISRIFTLKLDLNLILLFLAFSIILGVLVGIFPAVILSKFSAKQLVSKRSTRKVSAKTNLSKALIVIQFGVATLFLVSAHIAYNQYQFALNFDLGFDNTDVVNVYIGDHEKVATFKNELSRISEIESVSALALALYPGNFFGISLKSEKGDTINSTANAIDENYIPLMKHQIVAGDNFNRTIKEEQNTELIINEKLAKTLGFIDPKEAVGEILEETNGNNKLRIRGIVKDFYVQNIENEISEYAFINRASWFGSVNIKARPENLSKVLTSTESVWQRLFPSTDFNYTVMEDTSKQTYSEYYMHFTIAGFLALISTFISVFGLVGIGVYTAETRMKEVSIRKVLGASSTSLIKLLVKGFMGLLLLASLIAVPLAYYIFENLVLVNFANRLSIGVVELLSGSVAIMTIGFVTVGSLTYRAAHANPSDILRSE